MGETDTVKGRPTAARLDAVLTNLEKIVPTLGNRASRSASERLDAVQRILVYRTIETYDPDDRPGFARVMTELATQVPDSAALVELFSVAASTLYRWKSGESVPHKLVRAAVKEHLLHLLAPVTHQSRSDRSPRRDAN